MSTYNEKQFQIFSACGGYSFVNMIRLRNAYKIVKWTYRNVSDSRSRNHGILTAMTIRMDEPLVIP